EKSPGMFSNNKTDSISIVECYNGITRTFVRVIPNREPNILMSIIQFQVASSSIIWTDEHRSYAKLSEKGFLYNSVCHK
ncbi:hypothetical protein H312_02636, partial [Anncaliia algerae PRA339]